MTAYCIADARHPIFDGTGAMLKGGRWNSPGHPVIYAAETYSCALLEVLVHANRAAAPKNHRLVRIDIPSSIAIETVNAADHPGWDAEDLAIARAIGDRWLQERRTAVLRVPSVVTQARENNILINPLHPLFRRIEASAPEEIRWDQRLFLVQR